MAVYREALIGVKLAHEQFAKLEPTVKARVLEATEQTAIAIRNKAVSRAPVRWGYLRSSIDWSINKKTGEGRVGLRRGTIMGAIGAMMGKGGLSQSARIHVIRKGNTLHRTEMVMPSRYGHLVEFGTKERRQKTTGRRTGAVPRHENGLFMLPAAESERANYAQRVKGCGPDIERDLSVSRLM